jgi:small GTP-binding protein
MKTIKLKLVVLGEQNVGKSSILNRYKTKKFIVNSSSTIGVDFFLSNIIKNNTEYVLHIWDTSGQEKFNSIITTYYRNIAVALLIFDVSDRQSFLKLSKWFTNIEYYCKKDTIIKLIGNKCDKPKAVSLKEIKDLCYDYKLEYIEVSAKNNINIEDIFTNIIDEVDTKLIECSLVPNNNNGITIIDNFILEDDKPILDSKKPKCCTIL